MTAPRILSPNVRWPYRSRSPRDARPAAVVVSIDRGLPSGKLDHADLTREGAIELAAHLRDCALHLEPYPLPKDHAFAHHRAEPS